MTAPAPTAEACPRCSGEGIVSSLIGRRFGQGENEPSICPKCRGTGLRAVMNFVPHPTAAIDARRRLAAPLKKADPDRPYPPPMTDRADVRRVLVRGEHKYVLEVVRGARLVEAQITGEELRQLRDAADLLLEMED